MTCLCSAWLGCRGSEFEFRMWHLACKVVLYFEYISIYMTVLIKQSFCGCLGSVVGSDYVICSGRRVVQVVSLNSAMGYMIGQHLTAF